MAKSAAPSARFRALLETHGKTATGLEVPDDVVERLGAGRRPPVTVTIGKHSYRSTVFSMGGRFLLPLSRENREAAGVEGGQRIEVTVRLDTAPREVTVPDDLTRAFRRSAAARRAYEGLSYTHRREFVRWIEEAKAAETRERRLAKTLEMLVAGKTR
ncbi:MAG: YdeI/OmpD-associated family protein [Gemmatimonadales bacterium]